MSALRVIGPNLQIEWYFIESKMYLITQKENQSTIVVLLCCLINMMKFATNNSLYSKEMKFICLFSWSLEPQKPFFSEFTINSLFALTIIDLCNLWKGVHISPYQGICGINQYRDCATNICLDILRKVEID
ncbi:hypothetical protein PHYBLDRAFT_65120 [Phycomyces blakesleeanus NRRL 1555(-)]|uniref:Uncharacterized protein n=1 Tax=Phycomyces blakesleeanus (strain ATCC 8743b / DSM 1359 / FGSC 10004 / NBRC 33097 / NRRL 1555) TaxID=763407 RepID=A0A163AEN9_PHYB8|nr:hypothetical protein PHYBLDRAFT_65120 [Phycomyces blakesleeanus NRRL 1555(-)]OAD72951.1 hypothetical protein PHYBLDRAFT_65120 [Phycomyces blakesleeanus NRRL 1555(-)]|eukprot:XP_018290991.1 hypothetical protein PHYBLDRAFT_65120 [Phycomyces blakesleeanus NRRL 1555(-)]